MRALTFFPTALEPQMPAPHNLEAKLNNAR
jgi:hypothetical protein